MKLRVHGTLNRHFKVVLEKYLDLKPKEALGYCIHVLAICEAHVQRLKEKRIEAKSHLTQVVLPRVLEVGVKAKSLKPMINESTSEGIKRT
jgi:hypothetical protein